jgi:hypothetical protein
VGDLDLSGHIGPEERPETDVAESVTPSRGSVSVA